MVRTAESGRSNDDDTDRSQVAAYSINEAARRLGTSRATVYNLAGRGEIAIRKIGRRSVILDSEIRRFLTDAPIAQLARGRR